MHGVKVLEIKKKHAEIMPKRGPKSMTNLWQIYETSMKRKWIIYEKSMKSKGKSMKHQGKSMKTQWKINET